MVLKEQLKPKQPHTNNDDWLKDLSFPLCFWKQLPEGNQSSYTNCHSSVTSITNNNNKKDIVDETIGHVVVKLFHAIPWGTWTGQKHNTLTTPCFRRRNSHGSQSLMFSAPSWEFVKLRVNVSVSPLGPCAGNGSVESVFLCAGSGCRWRVSQRFWKSLRRSSIIWEQETGWGFALFAFMGEL